MFRPSNKLFILAIIPTMLALGCGENKFQQEVGKETLAVNLARETKGGDYDLITAEELKGLVDKKTDMVLIDAMPYEASYKSAHIPGAKQFLFSKDGEMKEWNTKETAGKTKEEYETLLGGEKDKLVIVYCGFVKCLRSHNAAVWAKNLGYTNVKRFPGGIYAWKGKGYATEAE